MARGGPMSELTLTPENETKLRRRQTGPLPSTAFVTEWTLEQTAGTAGTSPVAPVVLVVGFDGSEPAKRALDAAAALLRGREGRLEVVYVAQDPAGSTSSERFEASPSAAAADDLEGRLAHEVRARLDTTEPTWHFQRRDGAVAHELLDAADELRRHRGPDATIVLVVGGASNRHVHVAGSVPSHLAEVDRFPLVVVP
jgi:nucleotide-binding universal stress UspA family protein